MNTPETMRYIEVQPDHTLKIAIGPTPKPKQDEILIRVFAAGINRADILQRKGLYPPPADASPILGLEISGEIIQIGAQVQSHQVGDKVCGLTNGGGYAEYAILPATQALPWPENYDAVHAAAIPESYLTVWANVFMKGRFAKGETFLVHGGSSGIGVTAIQLVKEFGGKVYATAGSAEKCQACRDLGATECINYRQEDFEEHILRLTQNKGVDIILDMIGALYFEHNLNCLNFDGRLIEIATQKGAIVERLDLQKIMKKRLSITGSHLRPRSAQEKAAIAASLFHDVWPILSAGRCKPVVYKTFSFSEVNEAHCLMESSQHIGKIVITVEIL